MARLAGAIWPRPEDAADIDAVVEDMVVKLRRMEYDLVSTRYSPAPSNFLIFSYFLFSSFLFLNIPVFSMSLLHCSRYFQAALFFSLSHVCL